MSKRWFVVTAVLAGGMVAAVAVQWPELKRYVRMERM